MPTSPTLHAMPSYVVSFRCPACPGCKTECNASGEAAAPHYQHLQPPSSCGIQLPRSR
ncbi:hypothetical protein CC85DRAFT_281811 [Cutaneotrichosporon oleaginosum]|uniref:Uncharacterized protein n=1 Tax=Cutaneotrichosporon oleaginosum TaxID=879819 RepID=A0A0J1BDM2_9TREE|nr:uncharacterized protein CC85DRAFT_281811 [Cutaneotrichosporon oleaginosum]KLT46159.1 hypothetical protein CC85DRAFT_281811 [Cutaneotrichosporon oleaginosum]TXT10168.1 hypothetical protein COLE_04102 [Cutaneotrichosporon oleaginosum]